MISEVAVAVAKEVAKEAAKETSKEVAKETTKEIGKGVTKNGVDVSKRVEVGKGTVSESKSRVDIKKRIVPELKGKGLDSLKELTQKQKAELKKNGMSSSMIDKCKINDGKMKDLLVLYTRIVEKNI